jgi:hypothetical protein
MASVNLSDTAAVEDALEDNYKFFQENYQKFMDEDQHCSASHNLAEDKASQCEADKANLESSYCSLHGARQQICSDYDACFDEKKALFERILLDVQEVEAHTKSSYKSLSCLGRTVLQEMSSSRPSCNETAIDTTYLDVFYPSAPTEESCSVEVSTSRNYSANLCGEEGAADSEESGGEASGEQETPPPAEGNSTGGNASLVGGLNASAKNQFIVKGGKTADGKLDGKKANTAGGSKSSSSNPHR